LLLAHFGKEGKPEAVIPKISQETLAEMVGTTRLRVSFFMNRFEMGFITSIMRQLLPCGCLQKNMVKMPQTPRFRSRIVEGT
jgi:hypothetical protein